MTYKQPLRASREGSSHGSGGGGALAAGSAPSCTAPPAASGAISRSFYFTVEIYNSAIVVGALLSLIGPYFDDQIKGPLYFCSPPLPRPAPPASGASAAASALSAGSAKGSHIAPGTRSLSLSLSLSLMRAVVCVVLLVINVSLCVYMLYDCPWLMFMCVVCYHVV